MTQKTNLHCLIMLRRVIFKFITHNHSLLYLLTYLLNFGNSTYPHNHFNTNVLKFHNKHIQFFLKKKFLSFIHIEIYNETIEGISEGRFYFVFFPVFLSLLALRYALVISLWLLLEWLNHIEHCEDSSIRCHLWLTLGMSPI